MFCSISITKTTKKRLEELEATVEDLEYEIQKEQIKKPKIKKETILFLIDQLKDGDLANIEYRKRLINTFVHKVYLYDGKILLICNYTNTDTNTCETEFLEMADSLCSDIEAFGPPKRNTP